MWARAVISRKLVTVSPSKMARIKEEWSAQPDDAGSVRLIKRGATASSVGGQCVIHDKLYRRMPLAMKAIASEDVLNRETISAGTM